MCQSVAGYLPVLGTDAMGMMTLMRAVAGRAGIQENIIALENVMDESAPYLRLNRRRGTLAVSNRLRDSGVCSSLNSKLGEESTPLRGLLDCRENESQTSIAMLLQSPVLDICSLPHATAVGNLILPDPTPVDNSMALEEMDSCASHV